MFKVYFVISFWSEFFLDIAWNQNEAAGTILLDKKTYMSVQALCYVKYGEIFMDNVH